MRYTPIRGCGASIPKLILESDYEVLVAENVERLPAERLLEIFPKIREKAAF